MHWDLLGFKSNPFDFEPISKDTLALYSGRREEIKKYSYILAEKNARLVIEGVKGIGVTSFANYLRFSAQEKKDYLTPRCEIRVESDWSLATLLAVIVTNIVREIELFHPKMIKDKRFKAAKRITMRIAEVHRSFGIEAFGFGVSYGKSMGTSQPAVVPSPMMGHHLEDLAALVHSSGYRYGLLIQLNNLNVNVTHDEKHLRHLFNALRDYLHTPYVSWLLLGTCGLRQFISEQVERLSSIIPFELNMTPLKPSDFEELIKKRLEFFRFNEKIDFPVEPAVFSYLHEITGGRLSTVFDLLKRLIYQLHVDELIDKLTLSMVQPIVTQWMAHDRIAMLTEHPKSGPAVWGVREMSPDYGDYPRFTLN